MGYLHGFRGPDLQQVSEQLLHLGLTHFLQGEFVQGPEMIPDDALIPLLGSGLPPASI